MKEQIIENLDCRVHYWIKKGKGKDWLFFLHGAGLDHHLFDKQFDIIPKNYNILAWDARGHGKSTISSQKKIDYQDMLDDILLIFKQHRITSATFIGQSMGGYLAQDIAYYHPSLVKSMILIDCARNTNRLTRLEKVGLKLQPYILSAQPEPMLIDQGAKMCGKHPSTISFAHHKMSQMGKIRVIETLTSLRQAFHEDTSYKSHCPILLICGKEDKVSMVKKAMKTWRKKDKSAYQLVWIKNAGHCSNLDNPKMVNKVLKKHLMQY